MKKKVTQRDRIREIILTTDSGITSWEAFQEFGITRLSAIIYDLRHKENLDIVSIPVNRKNRYGETVMFYRYLLKSSLDKLT